MKKRIKKHIAILSVFVFALSFATTAFAAKTSDKKYKSGTEFGTITGTVDYIGKPIAGRKEVVFDTIISNLSNKGYTTKIYANVEIKDYATGVYRDKCTATTLTNKTSTGYYWQGHDDIVNNRTISAYGTHEARGYGSTAVFTNIYGF